MQNHPYTEVALDLAHVDDIRRWASDVTTSNAVVAESVIAPSETGSSYRLEAKEIYSGVEMTITLDGKPLHTFAIYGGIPAENDVERFIEAGGF